MKLNICHKSLLLELVDEILDYRGYKRINRLYATDKTGKKIKLLEIESKVIEYMHSIYRIDKKGYIIGKRRRRTKKES